MRALNCGILMLLANSLLFSCAKKENENSELSSISQVVSSENELPLCLAENTSTVYYIEAENKFVVCNGSKFIEVKGEKGEKGESGAKGEAGPPGSAGSSSNSGLWMYDGNGKAIGVVVDFTQGLVLFTNGGMTRVDLKTGDHNLPFAVSDTGGLTSAVCSYTQVSCAGTCYQRKGGTGVERPIKGAVYKSDSGYFVASGIETAQPVVIKSYGSGVSCGPVADDADDAFPITKLYAFPDGIAFPLTTPLSFGFKPED